MIQKNFPLLFFRSYFLVFLNISIITIKKKIVNKVSIKKITYDSQEKYSCAGVIKMSGHSAKLFFSKLNSIYKSKKHDAYYEEVYKDLFMKKKFMVVTLIILTKLWNFYIKI